MTTIRNGALHYAYEDENADILAIDRGPAGTARVSIQRGKETAVLAEHVTEICRHLADKADAKITVLDTSWICGDTQIVNMHRIGQCTAAGTVEAVIDGPLGMPPKVVQLTPKQARDMAAALAWQADIAEKAAADAAVEDLALVLRRVSPGMAPPAEDGDYRLAVCREFARAALAAGYRRTETADAQV